MQGRLLKRLRAIDSAPQQELDDDERFARKLLHREAVTADELLDALVEQALRGTPVSLRSLLAEGAPMAARAEEDAAT